MDEKPANQEPHVSATAPTAHALNGWPGKPPAFDSVDVTGLTLRLPLAMNDAAEAPQVLSGAVRSGHSPIAHPIAGQYRPIAPTDGDIAGPTQAMLFDSRRAPAVEVRVGNGVRAETAKEHAANEELDLAGWIDKLTRCGVGAARHDSPDLLEQLHQALRRPIDTIICVAMDVDPAACVQCAWAARHAKDLLAGIVMLARVTGAARRMLVIDGRSPSRWWSEAKSAARAADKSLRIVAIDNDYPQADPTLLLYTLLNRRLRPGRSPGELGVLLLDAVAAVAIGACALRDEPMALVPLALRDHDHGESYFLHAPVGLALSDLLHQLGISSGVRSEDSRHVLRGGDVLRDRRLDPSAAVVSHSELLVHLSSAPQAVNPDACIRCAWCFEACPTRIQPARLLDAAQCEDLELADRAGLPACIECGICTYVCPSHLPLLDGIRSLRAAEARG